ARPDQLRADRQDAIDAVEPYGNDRELEPRRDHADAAAKRLDRTRRRALALGKDQHRPSAARQLADVLQRLPRADFALWDGEGVKEEHAREELSEFVNHSRHVYADGLKCGLKNSFSNAVAPRPRQPPGMALRIHGT